MISLFVARSFSAGLQSYPIRVIRVIRVISVGQKRGSQKTNFPFIIREGLVEWNIRLCGLIVLITVLFTALLFSAPIYCPMRL